MKYSVNVPESVALAAKAAAEARGINQATWTREVMVAALDPAGPDDGGEVLAEVREDLEKTRQVLATVTDELDRTRADLEASGDCAGELERIRAQLTAERERSKQAELSLEQVREEGFKALENANKIVASRETQIQGLESHIEDLRRTLSLAEGQLAEAARREREILSRIPMLPEKTGQPWWSRLFKRT